MKNISVLIIGLAFLLFGSTGMCNTTEDSPTGAQTQTSAANAVNIISSADLASLANNWANEFGRLNPSIKVNVSQIGHVDVLTPGQVSLVADANPAVTGKNWKMVVGRDATVAIVNANNPMLKELQAQGVSVAELASILADPEKSNWKNLLEKGQNAPVNFVAVESEKVKENIAEFAGLEPGAFKINTVANSSEIISALQKDKYAIGFCKLTDVREAGSNKLSGGIELLPFDKNSNGRIDSFENIYANLESFTRGVWIGKYPRALCGGIYAVSATMPTDKNTLAFLTWITTDGQNCLNTNGYSYLTSAEVKSNLAALSGNVSDNAPDTTAGDSHQPFTSNFWLATLLFTAFSALLYVGIVRFGRKQKWANVNPEEETSPVLNEDKILAPKGLYFDKTHTWAYMEQDGNVKMGIDDFLQHVTGTLTRVILQNKGHKVRKGDKILTIIKDGKQLNIYAPISGTIVQHNTSLLSDSTLLNTSPYTEGWVYLIEPTNWAREMRFLFMGDRYKEWIEDEFSRLKDFLATVVRTKTPAYSPVILQDGGELADNILANLEPEVWEDFQIKFINTSK